ncbi:MAG: hypothetical protein FWE24_09475 [Defluviitaleaceae bacterium]|nr:hypothetical protein [Defluviitaleaceae bacterium]
MDEMRLNFAREDQSETSPIKRIFDQHASETISDYDVRRLLAPVHGMIDEGKFDKPRIFSWWPQTLVMMAAAITLVVIMTLSNNDPAQETVHIGTFVEITNPRIPLAGVPLVPDEDYVLSEFAIMPIRNIENINFVLVNETTLVEVSMITEEFGEDYVFTFQGISDGIYKLKAFFNNGSGAHSAEVGRVTIVNGTVELTIKEDLVALLN